MHLQPVISVVIPLYNKAFYIQRAIRSVLQQTFRDFEVIVVDDGSTDESAAKVQAFDDPLIRLIQQQNRGESGARNRGVEEANADLIAFLDADDEWKPEFLATILNLLERFPEAGIFASTYELINPEGVRRSPQITDIPSHPWEGILPNFFRNALHDYPFNASSVAIRKVVFEKVGGFPQGIKLAGDLDLWVRAALQFSIAYSTFPQAIIHQEAENRASQMYYYGNTIPFEASIQAALKEQKLSPTLRLDLLELLARNKILAAYHAMMMGDRIAAKKMLDSIEYTRRFRWQVIWWRIWTNLPIGFFHAARKTHSIFKKLWPTPP